MTSAARPKGQAAGLARHLALTLVVAACQPEPPGASTFAIHVSASDALGQPVAGASVWLAGQARGKTNAEGNLESRWQGPGDSVLDLLLACPPGHVTEAPERRVPLRAASRDDGKPTPLRVALTCTAEQPLSAVVIRAAPGLPVLIDGKRMGQTDADGTEHLLLQAIPGSTLQVTLDTSDAPDLMPQHPVTSLHAEPQDQLLLVDQAFTRKPKRHRRKTRRQAPPSPPSLPVRIH